MILESKADILVTYDIKRRAPISKIVIPKDLTALIKNSEFQLFKQLKVTERFLKLILSDRYLIINLDNLEVTEDTEIDILIHEQTQRENLITRGSKHQSIDTSYCIACVHD